MKFFLEALAIFVHFLDLSIVILEKFNQAEQLTIDLIKSLILLMLNLDYNGTRLLVHSGSKVQGSDISFTKANKKDFLSCSKCSTCLESSREALDGLKALSKLMRVNRCLLIVPGALIYRVLGLGAQETKKQSEVLQNQI